MGWTTEESGFNSHKVRNLSSITSRAADNGTGACFPEVKAAEV
jgi:hypothetical protein